MKVRGLAFFAFSLVIGWIFVAGAGMVSGSAMAGRAVLSGSTAPPPLDGSTLGGQRAVMQPADEPILLAFLQDSATGQPTLGVAILPWIVVGSTPEFGQRAISAISGEIQRSRLFRVVADEHKGSSSGVWSGAGGLSVPQPSLDAVCQKAKSLGADAALMYRFSIDNGVPYYPELDSIHVFLVDAHNRLVYSAQDSRGGESRVISHPEAMQAVEKLTARVIADYRAKSLPLIQNRQTAPKADVAGVPKGDTPPVKGSSPAAQGQQSAQEEFIIHRVYDGETLATIAKWYSGDPDRWQEIAKANPSLTSFELRGGDLVKVPAVMATVNKKQPKFSTAGEPPQKKAVATKPKPQASPAPEPKAKAKPKRPAEPPASEPRGKEKGGGQPDEVFGPKLE